MGSIPGLGRSAGGGHLYIMFSFLYCFFCWTEAFQFDVVPLADFALVACVLGGHMNKIVAKTDVKLLFLSDFSWEFIVSGLMCKSVIHAELIFVHGVRLGSSFLCLHHVMLSVLSSSTVHNWSNRLLALVTYRVVDTRALTVGHFPGTLHLRINNNAPFQTCCCC